MASREKIVEGFGVYDEWGPLREVFVGRADTFQFGEEWNEIYAIASPEFQAKWKANEGKRASVVWPQYTTEFQAELDGLAAAYEAHGVKVHRPRAMTKVEIQSDPIPAGRGVWQCSPADAQWVIGRNYIETAMRIPLPRNNYLWARDVFVPILDKTLSDLPDPQKPVPRWLACPHSEPTEDLLNADGPYLDGGDILLVGNGRDVLVGLDQYSTNQYGIDWLQGALADDGYRIWPVTFDKCAMHLSGNLNLIRPGLMIIYPKAFAECPALPAPVRDWERIELSKQDAENGGADCVMLDENTAIVADGQLDLRNKLEAMGITTIPVKLTRAFEASSGVRCCTILVHREKAS